LSLKSGITCDEITHNEDQLEIVEQQFFVADNLELEMGEEEDDTSMDLDLPVALRKGVRSTVGKPPTTYGFESGNDDDDDRNHIANYVSYESLSLIYRAFVASLQLVMIPKD